MKIQKQAGITLIELMIALVLGLLVSGTVITIFISNVKSTTENIKMVHLNQELRSVMNFISDEIKRTGYSADETNSAFMAEYDWYTATNCLRYAYDDDGDGTLDATERFGFRLGTGAAAGEIQWTNTGTSAADCSGTGWQPLTETGVANITIFSITPNPVAAGSLTVNQIVVSITGETTLNPDTATRTITETIRVRNEDDT